jgi:DUF1680 family protein
MLNKHIVGVVLTLSMFATAVHAQHVNADYPIQPVPFTSVHLTDDFWRPRLETNAKVTIPYILEQCRKHGRIDNFLIAAHKKKGKLSEFPFDDTDLYKLIEGASYSLQETYDATLDKQLDTLIQIIGDAQEADGYLYTFRTANVEKPHEWIGSTRWEKDSILSHELYNSGHLFESAVAHYAATGKKSLLNIAIKNADLLVKTFGPDKLHEYPGHQIVELGLVKMYRVTGKQDYLKLAKFFLDVRGPGGDAYNQADKRVVDQKQAEGHAVRAAYMYTGMADVAALTNDEGYLDAIDTIWSDVALHKLYITGGIGATGNGEAFGDAYDLPNMSAYAETCAAIGNVYWNQRMFLLHGDAKYMDVLERTLYNGLLSGISLSGDRFFYPNLLASVGQHARSAWFSCACCITNMTRFLPSMPGYIYASNNNDLYVNLYVSNDASVKLKSTTVKLQETTAYPWQGNIAITVSPAQTSNFTVRLRMPGWANNQPVTGSDLYAFMNLQNNATVPVYVNGKKVNYIIEKGYAVIKREWKKGDKLTLEFPMPVEKVVANTNIKADVGRLALQRGPIVYCIEGVDQKDSAVQSIVADTNYVINTVYKPGVLNGITELSFKGYEATKDGSGKTADQTVTAIPYYSWNNRGSGEMEVWIPYKNGVAKPKPLPTIASKAKVSASVSSKLMLKALNDQYDPLDSRDQSVNYLHFWPAKDTSEWIQYDFDQPYTISKSKVYWYDDKPWGGCDLPANWKLYYKQGNDWLPVENTTPYEIAKDKYNAVEFKPVTTTALRMVIQLPKEDASGVHEWIVE